MQSCAEQDDAAGVVAEYGSAQLLSAVHPDDRKSTGEGRSCGSYFAGRDWPVLMLPWLLFTMSLLTFGIGPLLLSILALFFGLYISGVLAYLSIGRGGPWMYFSVLCGFSAVMGLVFGLLFRTEAALHTAEGRRTLGACIIILLVYLLVVLAISRALPPLGCALIGSSADFAEKHGWGWNPLSAASMRFGLDGRSFAEMLTESHEFPEQVSADLLKHRAYWSGEPAFDYVFHVANEHAFVGVLLAHPAHPYEKYERLLVLLLVSVLIVFPVAAFTVTVRNEVLRGIVVLILVTAPRNLLRLYLKRIVIADDEIVHRDLQEQKPPPEVQETGKDSSVRSSVKKWQGAVKGAMGKPALVGRLGSSMTWREAATRIRASNAFWWEAATRIRASNAFWWEISFFSVGIFVAGLIILLACLFVEAHTSTPLGVVLLESTSGLGWAFVLELIFDQLIMHRPSDKHQGVEEKWFVGFFHRWREERDEYMKKSAD